MNFCACLGPQNGDPVCPCQMRSGGHQGTYSNVLEVLASYPPMTASQIFEQRVSFVFGQLGGDSKLTKDDVREILRKHYGVE